VIPRVAVIPHLETFGRRWIPGALGDAATNDAVLLGIDERSAALWREGVWRATGPGAVTVFAADGSRRRSESGATIEGVPAPLTG
jgi:hypothetical protein